MKVKTDYPLSYRFSFIFNDILNNNGIDLKFLTSEFNNDYSTNYRDIKLLNEYLERFNFKFLKFNNKYFLTFVDFEERKCFKCLVKLIIDKESFVYLEDE